MTVAEMSMGGSLIGRKEKSLDVRRVGEVEESDLALLASERGIAPRPIGELRDRHHALARCLATGISQNEASAITGYTPSRVSVLARDPMFKQLVSHYKDKANAAFADFHERASQVTLEAINQIQEELELDAERNEKVITVSEKLAIVETLADRTGHAPVAKSVSVHANVDLGGRLQAARSRIIEGEKSGGGTGG